MKICFLAGTLARGGAERQLLFMLESLVEQKIEIKLLSLTRGEAYEDDVKRLGIDVEWVGHSQNRFRRVFRIARSVGEWSADILQSSHFYTNIYAGLAARLNRTIGIGAIRSDLRSEVAINGIYSKGQLLLPHHLIANSRLAMERAVSLGVSDSRIDYVPNVVRDPESHNGGLSDGKDAVHISFVGRLSQEKRPDLFVELASRLSKELPQHQLRFSIAGDGPLRDEVSRLISAVGQGDTGITLLGELGDPATLYRETDILVLTSRYEGTPNVVLEAMAHGIPVIAPAVGGIPEVLDANRGILVEPTDFEALVAASKSLITDKLKRRHLGSNAKAFAVDMRSPSKLGDKLLEIYTRLLR